MNVVPDQPEVLVVDDDAAAAESVAEILGISGIFATSVTTPAAAMEVAIERRPGVVVLDQRLPGMSGLDLAAALKARDPDVSVILLTGFASLESAISAIGTVDEYLTKPAPPEQLLRAVRAALERCGLRRHNRELVAELEAANRALETAMGLRTRELEGLIAAIGETANAVSAGALVSEIVAIVARAVDAGGVAVYLLGPGATRLERVAQSGAEFPDHLVPWRTTGDATDHVLDLVASGERIGCLVVRSPHASTIYLRTVASLVSTGIQHLRRLAAERETVEKLEELSRLKSSFLATVSHELLTPLTAILGFGQLLADMSDAMEPEQQRDAILRILGQGGRLKGLINQLLDATRAESGGFDLRPVPVDVAAVLEAFAADRSEVELHVSDELPKAWADPGRFRQAVEALVRNALAHNAPGSSVVLGAVSTPETIEIFVQDHGPGIDPVELERVFAPFVQLDDSDSRRHAGLGLGLYITRAVIEAMGGHLDVDTAPGQGCRFAMRLPIAT